MKNTIYILFILIFSGCAGTLTEKPEDSVIDYQPTSGSAAAVTEVSDSAETASDTKDSSEFTISKEEYQLTLTFINSLIDNINNAIRDKDFDTWKTYLSLLYIDAYDSPEDLETFSSMLKQKGYETRLVNLRDFFDYIVVASRENLEISHLEFLDETHLKVMTIYRNESAVLYYMEHIQDEWKISVW